MFTHARIKLTLWYLLIIMIVSGFFSLIVYRGFTKELGRGFRMQAMHGNGPLIIRDNSGYQRILPFVIYPEEVAPQEYVEIINFAKHRFALQLFIINGGILILAGMSGYFLAGKTLRPIEVMVNEQKRFVADASHELRTPISSIKTENEVFLRSKKMKLTDAKKLLKSNLSEIEKMKHFTDYLLSLSRYESNGNIKMETVDLTEAVKQAIAGNEKQAKVKRIKLDSKLESVEINGNPQSLVELFSILINNAIKYSPQKTKIKITLKKLKKSVIVEVKDRGIGINKKDLPHIFDRFYRADTSRSKVKADGFGLGLSIAKSIADAHRGEIKVTSEVGKGTTFRVSLQV